MSTVRSDRRIKRLTSALSAVRAEMGRVGPTTRRPRGVALLLVLLILAISTAFATEYSYKANTRLHVAANIRDDVKAYYLARASMEIAALVIRNKGLANRLAQMAGRKGAGEFWKIAEEFANAFCTGELKMLGRTFMDFRGLKGAGLPKNLVCGVRVAAEDGKININRVDNLKEKQDLFGALYRELVTHREEPLAFGEIDKEFAELALNIVDWADYDKNRTDYDPTTQRVVESPQGENLQAATAHSVPKNAKFDTLSELQMVEGLSRQMYCDIVDKFTPYATSKLNVNEAPLATLRAMLCDPRYLRNAAEMCTPQMSQLGMFLPIDHVLNCADMCRSVFESLKSPGFSTRRTFTNFIKQVSAGIHAPPQTIDNAINQAIGYSSKMVRIESVGGSYGTWRGLTAVIDTQNGNFVYWREY